MGARRCRPRRCGRRSRARRCIEQRTLRLFGIPESEIAETLREAEREGVELDRLEVTTCLKRGEIEIVTRYEPDAEAVYEAFARGRAERHADTLFSTTAARSTSRSRRCCARRWAVGARRSSDASPWPSRARAALLAARLTDPAGASDYVRGGVVAYANEAKISQAGVDRPS